MVGELPFGSGHVAVLEFVDKHGIKECSWDGASRTVYCKVGVGSKGAVVTESRLMQFVFSEDDRLTDIQIKQGLTGP